MAKGTLEKSANHVKRARRFGMVGLSLQPVGFLLVGSLHHLDQPILATYLGLLTLLLGVVLACIGIWNYAKSKGYGTAIAALSFFYVYGLRILILLPDKNR